MRKFLVQLASRLGLYKSFVKIDTRFKERKLACNFRKYGLEALQKLDEAVSSVDGHAIPYFGTLLGAIRDHGFIPYDNDLDVALPIEDRPDNFIQLMALYGFKHEKQNYIKESGRVVEDTFSYHGTQVDIFYLFNDREDGKVYSYVARRHETKEWREANATDGFPCVIWPTERCDYKRRDFLGIQLYFPSKAQEWMRDIYGETYLEHQKVWSEKKQKTVIEYPKVRLFRR